MKISRHIGKLFLISSLLSLQTVIAQVTPVKALVTGNDQYEKLVRGYYAAYEKKDWNSLEQILTKNFTFSSPMDDHISLSEYKVRCWPNSANIRKFDLDKLVINGNEAFVTYNGWTTNGKLFRNTEYFNFKDGKISQNECFFGRGISFPNSGK
jgi:SnoaL-like domain